MPLVLLDNLYSCHNNFILVGNLALFLKFVINKCGSSCEENCRLLLWLVSRNDTRNLQEHLPFFSVWCFFFGVFFFGGVKANFSRSRNFKGREEKKRITLTWQICLDCLMERSGQGIDPPFFCQKCHQNKSPRVTFQEFCRRYHMNPQVL